MKNIHTCLFVLFLCFTQSSIAQVAVEVGVSKTTVTPYEVFKFQIVTNKDCPLTPINFGKLEVLGTPYTTQNNSYMNINGVQSSRTEYVTVYQLRATKAGNYTIPKVAISCEDNKIHRSESSIRIRVTEEEDQAHFMRLESNKSDVLEGEPFIVTLKYFSSEKPETLEGIELGDAASIWRQDLAPGQQTFTMNQEKVNGQMYYTVVLREELCFAQNKGTVILTPYVAHFVFRQDFFNAFRRDTYSNALEINVNGINSDHGDYKNLVGNFSTKAVITSNNKTVEIGEVIDYTLTVSGVGNLRQELVNSKVNFPKSFNNYDPEIAEKIAPTKNGIEGEINYQFTLVPTKPGTYTIPPFELEYYDLKRKSLKTARTEAFDITVTKPENYIQPLENTESTEETGIDEIRYIDESEGDFFQAGDFFFGSWTYYLFLLFPIAVSTLLILTKRKKENLSEDDLLKIKQKKALKVAQAELSVVQTKIDTGESKTALKDMQTAMNQFLQQKLGLTLSELSQRQISLKLESASIPVSLVETFNRIWNAIEMGQYAPTPDSNLRQLLTETETLIIELDKKL